jgi:hypothetical protein
MSCRSCGADVVWVTTEAGKRMPVDASPHPDGNVLLLPPDTRDVSSTPRASVLGPLEVELATAALHRSHFATCPHADAWRRSR